MRVLYRVAAACGVLATAATLFVLFVAYNSVPLVKDVLATGVPVVYYGQVMVLLLSGTIGIGVALVVLYLGSGKRYHKSRQKDYTKRLFEYGGVGFLTLGAPALLMDPAAMSVGMGVVVIWKILATQQSELRESQEALIEEKEPLAERNPEPS
jgi:hypothetical protein